MTNNTNATGTDKRPERRRTTRFEVSGRVLGTIVSFDLPVRVRDFGAGGFSIETVEPIDAGEVHRVRFTAIDDWTAELQAKSLHCRPSVASDGTPRYVTGFVFPSPAPADENQLVQRLITKVTSLPSLDDLPES